jgi:hypothetical protein
LQQPLLDSQVGPRNQIQAEAEAIPEDSEKCPQDTPTRERNWGEINVSTVVRKGTGKMNVANGSGTPKRLPRPRGRSQVVKGKYQSTHRFVSPWEENIVSLAGLTGYEEDWDRPGSILLGPEEPMVQMKIGCHPTDFMVDTGTEHSVVTQLLRPLSSRHTTIIWATGDWVRCPFLMAR